VARVVRVKVAKTIQPNDRCQLITRVGPKKPLAWPRAGTGAVWVCVGGQRPPHRGESRGGRVVLSRPRNNAALTDGRLTVAAPVMLDAKQESD
jgi:hypothetical protein